MALVKKDNSAAETKVAKPAAADAPVKTKPTVEADPATEPAGEQPNAETQAAMEEARTMQAQKPAATAVAVQKPTGVGMSTRLKPVLDELKNALTVDYNTLARLQVNQGSYLMVDKNKLALGDTVDFELLSFQDNFVLSPGSDGPEALEFVKYSNDGVTTNDGFNVAEYIEKLKDEGYPKAAVKPRCVLVIQLEGSSKNGLDEHYDKLYQIDLAPTSKSKFDAFRAQTSFDVTRGKKTAEQAVKIRSAVSTVTKGPNTWSVADFTYQS